MCKVKTKNLHIALLVIMLSALSEVKAQQQPIFTNYTNSYAYVNAGFAGMSEGINVLGLYRQQWAGFVDNEGNEVAPTTYLITGDMPIRALHGGLGFSVLKDHIGFEDDTNIGIGYSFHLDLGGSTLGIGIAGTLCNRTVDFGQLHPGQENDPILQGLGEESDMLFDFNLGLFWQLPESFYVGVSAVNVLQTMTKALSDQTETSASFVNDRTFYLVAGYPFQFEEMPSFTFVPSLGAMTNLSSWQINVGGKVVFRDLFSLGVNYRPQESVGLTVGLKIKDISIGYAYDINTMGLGGVPGSHEIALGYCFKLDLDRTPRDYRSVRYL